MFRPHFQCNDRKDTTSGSHIEKFCLRCYIFFQLTDTQLCSLMHTGSEGSARIDMNDHFVFVFFFYFFPGRNDQDIIHIKLFEIFFPVVDPVNVFRLVNCDTSFSDLAEHPQRFQFFFHLGKNLFFGLFFSIYRKSSVFCLFHKKTQISDSIVFRSIRQNIHKHLLLFHCSQRYFVFNLCAFQPDII